MFDYSYDKFSSVTGKITLNIYAQACVLVVGLIF